MGILAAVAMRGHLISHRWMTSNTRKREKTCQWTNHFNPDTRKKPSSSSNDSHRETHPGMKKTHLFQCENLFFFHPSFYGFCDFRGRHTEGFHCNVENRTQNLLRSVLNIAVQLLMFSGMMKSLLEILN